MAFIVGYVTKEERKRLEARGWEVEDATDYPNLVGEESHNLVGTPPEGKDCIVVFTDASGFEIMSGPDWAWARLHRSGRRPDSRPTGRCFRVSERGEESDD